MKIFRPVKNKFKRLRSKLVKNEHTTIKNGRMLNDLQGAKMLQIDLSKKIAVVTGATGQIGRVIVKTLARCGADVGIHYFTNQQQAEKLLAEVKSLGVHGMMVQTDFTNFDSVLTMHDIIARSLGKPQIIVNTAVIQYQPWTNVLEQPIEDYESQFRSCVLQNIFMAKAFVPDMIQANYGRIIAINTECSM